MTQLYVGIAVAVLVGVYVWLRRSQKHSETNLPVVSEDVNLPAVSEPNPPMTQSNMPPSNEQPDNNESPQQ